MTLELTANAMHTRAADGRTMIGHVIVCQGPDDSGRDVVAVWQVSPDGVNTGAWTMPVSVVHRDPTVARMLLDRCVQRAVTAWDPAATITVLATLERAARVAGRDRGATAIAIPEVLAEIGEVRSAFEKRVAEQRHTRSDILPLEWEVELADPIPRDTEELRTFANLALPEACPAIREALLLSHLLRWCVRRWRETVTILSRRDFLRPDLDRLGALPRRWESRLADAYVQARRGS